MKKVTMFSLLMFSSFLVYNCTVSRQTTAPTIYSDLENKGSEAKVSIEFKNGPAFNHPTYVVWMESMSGEFIRTLFITQAYANGIFGHQMVGDSVWLKTAGKSIQPAALPYWTHKKGLIKNQVNIPDPDHPYVDAYTGATPLNNFNFITEIPESKPYRIMVEVNQPWDWNNYWTNNKYPDCDAYKHSAQPSIIYGVSINNNHMSFYLNPVGYGDPKGESGKLFTQLNTLSSAKNIFETIQVNLTHK
jgi:hypothetical protein